MVNGVVIMLGDIGGGWGGSVMESIGMCSDHASDVRREDWWEARTESWRYKAMM